MSQGNECTNVVAQVKLAQRPQIVMALLPWVHLDMQVISVLESLVAVLATQFLLVHMVLVLNLLVAMLAMFVVLDVVMMLGTMLVTIGF